MTGLHKRCQMDAIGEPIFDYERWETHRSNDRYAATRLLPLGCCPIAASPSVAQLPPQLPPP